MKHIIYFLTAILMTLCLCAGVCLAETADTDETSREIAAQSHILVAYFSCTGNTKGIAQQVAPLVGGDLYEITPQDPYTDADLNYNDNKSRSTLEMNDESIRPAILGSVEGMENYDVIFLGYPIWWGKAPRIISTFLESYDFAGKTIAPFCTSGSSGVGSSARQLHALCDETTVWLDGVRLPANASVGRISEWIEGLELENVTVIN